MTDNPDLYDRFLTCLGFEVEPDNNRAMKTNSRVILERCIEEGTKRGYIRAFKHTDSPSESGILQSIDDAIWLEIDTYFKFEE